MTNAKEKMERVFSECRKFFGEIKAMDERKEQAQDKIKTLQDEIVKLKEERPALLAEGKDVSKINKRLKKIEEEIEVNQDLIKGVDNKKKNLQINIYNARVKKQEAFQDYIKSIMKTVAKEYMEIAPKFAEVITRYILLEFMLQGSDKSYVPAISYKDIKRIPCLNSDKSFFNYKLYDLYINYEDDIREKYQIPEYEVRRISRLQDV
ncbi:MAG: hypothetical protein V8R83_05495 [Candidatus Gastranaerophilaceae bacterium]